MAGVRAQPAYSLQNMPQTRFSCYDKILGGYYADAETQCQMFHVCVKVAGVGVQDFRFLCPNGTAFDQEAQICADWGDVDCEQSVLYYGSDNFDLYRIGSGFESKRAPLAEEDESTFHLQRAESGDIRRSKETRIDQKSRPDQPPNYAKRFDSTARNTFNNHQHQQQQQQNHANFNGNNRNSGKPSSQQVAHKTSVEPETTKKPIVSYYTPTVAATTKAPQPPSSLPTTSTTTITTARSFTAGAATPSNERYNSNNNNYNNNNSNNYYNNNEESKQDFYDDIFKGSHSSHFFANRNGGREDDFIDRPHIGSATATATADKVKLNASHNDVSRKDAKTRANTSTPAPLSSAPTASARVKRPLHSVAEATTPVSVTAKQQHKKIAPTAHAVVVAHGNGKGTAHASQPHVGNYKTQEHIQPTTYNPGHNNIYRLKATTPKYSQTQRVAHNANVPLEAQTKSKITATSASVGTTPRKSHKYAESARESTFVAPNEFSEFTKVVKTQHPQPFKASDKTDVRVEPQFFRTRGRSGGETVVGQPTTNDKQEPSPFSASQKPQPAAALKSSARGFASRGSINYKATTIKSNDHTPTTASGTGKKFSTLVPKELYTSPTTFKPISLHKKTFDSPSSNHHKTQQSIRPTAPLQKSSKSSTTTSTISPTTGNTYYNIDEDDGQYHPELYESDFPRNRVINGSQRPATTRAPTTTPKPTHSTTTKRIPNGFNLNYENAQNHLKTQQQSAFQKQQEISSAATATDFSDEDEELFKTAHSLNFGAASINKLRADIIKAEKTSQQYNSQYSPNIPYTVTSPKPFTTVAVAGKPFSTTVYASLTSTKNNITTVSTFPTWTTPIPNTTTTYQTNTTTKRPSSVHTTSYSTLKNPTKPSKGKKANKLLSKRPPHADEDTSYDYAYYDSDTLSESPQDFYPEYEFAEFKKTRKN